MVSAYYSRNSSYSRSYNAAEAESQNRFPLTRAKKFVADDLKCSQSVAAAALELMHDGEWHHVGKYASEVNYYDTIDRRLPGVVAHIKACGGAKKFAERRKVLRASRKESWPSAQQPRRFLRLSELARRARALLIETLGRDCFCIAIAIAYGERPVSGDNLATWLAWRGCEPDTIRQALARADRAD